MADDRIGDNTREDGAAEIAQRIDWDAVGRKEVGQAERQRNGGADDPELHLEASSRLLASPKAVQHQRRRTHEVDDHEDGEGVIERRADGIEAPGKLTETRDQKVEAVSRKK